MLIYYALARGGSAFRVRELTPHARTALWLLQQFLPLRATVTPADAAVRVAIEPG